MSEYPLSTEPGIDYPVRESQPTKPQNDYRAQEAQLVISLKFHHAQTFSDIPLDVALNAVVKVWESCQADSTKQQNDMIKKGAT